MSATILPFTPRATAKPPQARTRAVAGVAERFGAQWSTRHAEVAIVDTADREPQHGELYAVAMVTVERARATASLAIVQAYQRDGALWCRNGFKVPGPVPLCDGPFTADGWRQKCAGRIVGVMRPTWQACR